MESRAERQSGVAKAALEALNGIDLRPWQSSSIIHVLPDEIARARITSKT